MTDHIPKPLLSAGSSKFVLNCLKGLAVAAGLAYTLMYLAIAILRMAYPFELEWMEGGSVEHVGRILSGQAIYCEPSIEFIPFLYPPLYYYVSAAASHVLGFGFFPLRLVSFTASLVTASIIFVWTWRETASLLCSVIACGLFFAGFKIGGAWFDIARIDSLLLMFLVAGLCLIRFHTTAVVLALAAVLFSMAFLVKQSAQIAIIAAIAFVILRDLRRGIMFLAVVIIVIALSCLLLHWRTDGWFGYYVFSLGSNVGKTIFWPWIGGFWVFDLIGRMPIALAFFLWLLLDLFQSSDREKCLFYLLAAGGMLGMAFSARLVYGGYFNGLTPAYAFLGLTAALGLDRLGLRLDEFKRSMKQSVLALAYLLIVFQFGLMAYNPLRQIPSDADLRAGWSLVERIGRIDGDVLAPSHVFLPAQAGKKTYVHDISIWALYQFGDTERKQKFGKAMEDALQSRKFAAIILDNKNWHFMSEMLKFYSLQGKVFGAESVFWTVTGNRTRPEHIYIPKKGSGDR
jgi:4-amino-4-deoxy-L-arabinose transferase-like glycosyltransferase